MNELTTEILTRAIEFARKKFRELWDNRYSYHNFDHTLEVYENTRFIGEHEGLSSQELLIVGIAAIFHDIGHLIGNQNHEERSVSEARDFLAGFDVNPEQVERIVEAILATRIPQNPSGKVCEVICDADLMYLAGEEFFIKAESLRREWWTTGRAEMEPPAFLKYSLNFIKNHQYHTQFGKTALTPSKERNLLILEDAVSKKG